MTTQKELRAAFWRAYSHHEGQARKARILTAPQNRHSADTRAAFVEYVDWLHRDGQISDALAARATL
jgi:hypothetical protein